MPEWLHCSCALLPSCSLTCYSAVDLCRSRGLASRANSPAHCSRLLVLKSPLAGAVSPFLGDGIDSVCAPSRLLSFLPVCSVVLRWRPFHAKTKVAPWIGDCDALFGYQAWNTLGRSTVGTYWQVAQATSDWFLTVKIPPCLSLAAGVLKFRALPCCLFRNPVNLNQNQIFEYTSVNTSLS